MDSAEFETHRSMLFGIAYRMLGTVADAEDLVHETYLRAHQQEPGSIAIPRAWLIATITRLCIDQLRLARRQREDYYGVWLPEPLLDDSAPSPADHAVLADSLSYAFLTVLETLSPDERAVFLLREVFSHDYDEVAGIVGKSEAACRQIVARAKAHLAERKPRFTASSEQVAAVLQRFQAARDTGDMNGLLSVLADDVTFIGDGGGRRRSVGRPIRSADHVARFFLGIRDRVPPATYRLATINQRPGFLMFVDGQLYSATTFDIEEGRICAIYSVTNPDKLRHLEHTG